jgi:Protein of unknown function (DUF3631)
MSAPDKPPTQPFTELPAALQPFASQRRWVLWKWQKGKNKWTKPPYQPSGKHAKSDDPSTWITFDEAFAAYRRGGFDGVGLALLGVPLLAIDIDDCRNDETGEIAPAAGKLVDRADTYTEITPSGTGLRIIGRDDGPELHQGKRPLPHGNGTTVEVYRNTARYICVTGRLLGGAAMQAVPLTQINGFGDKLATWLDQQAKHAKKPKEEEERKGHKPKKLDLEDIIRNGEGGHFGGDRSRAVWFVIHALLKQEKTAEEVAAVLLERSNGISAHIYDQPKPEDYARKQIEKAQKEQAGDPDVEIERLARLSAVEYDHQRKEAAEKLGVRASILDKLVQGERARLGRDGGDDKLQGSTVTFDEIEPWPEPVTGAQLLNDIASVIRSHVIMSDHCRDIDALWVVHTYVIRRFKISPKLSIRSPARRCGKTTLLEVLAELVFRAWTTGSITKAALFRVIDKWHPTLLIDEVDTFVGEDEELRGILNHGHRYDGYVTRTVGDDHEPRKFSVYAAVALSGIGGLAETLADRSVTVDLKRRRPSETIARLRIGRMGHLHELRRRIVRWVADHEDRIAERDPEMPSIIDREADNWQVLLAVADEAEGEWPARARKAAEQAHVAGAGDDGSRLELLLGDIRDTFTAKGTKVRDMFGMEQIEITSGDVVKTLVALESRPWAEMGKSGKPITQNRLARMLKPLGIAPKNVGPEDARVRGYILADFKEVFERYLAPLPAGGSHNRPSAQNAMK